MDFAHRHIGPADAQQQRMLDEIGHSTLDDLTAAALPADIAARGALRLPGPLTEEQALAGLRQLAARNTCSPR